MQKRFHNYQLLRELKRSILSTTYLASPLQHPERSVVVKLFDPSAFFLSVSRDQFLATSATFLKLKHPSLVPLLDAGIAEDQAYLVSAYVSGGSLRNLLDRNAPRPLPVVQAVKILIEVGQALIYLHTCQVIHGHLKPEHILFQPGGRAALIDISLAGEPPQGLLERDHPASLFRYLAPEQFLQPGSYLSDQYALCCIAYELLTGQAPFTQDDFPALREQIQKEPPPPLIQHMPDLPSILNNVVLRGLAKEPERRYPNMLTFVSVLQAYLSTTPPRLHTGRRTTDPTTSPTWPPAPASSISRADGVVTTHVGKIPAPLTPLLFDPARPATPDPLLAAPLTPLPPDGAIAQTATSPTGNAQSEGNEPITSALPLLTPSTGTLSGASAGTIAGEWPAKKTLLLPADAGTSSHENGLLAPSFQTQPTQNADLQEKSLSVHALPAPTMQEKSVRDLLPAPEASTLSPLRLTASSGIKNHTRPPRRRLLLWMMLLIVLGAGVGVSFAWTGSGSRATSLSSSQSVSRTDANEGNVLAAGSPGTAPVRGATQVVSTATPGSFSPTPGATHNTTPTPAPTRRPTPTLQSSPYVPSGNGQQATISSEISWYGYNDNAGPTDQSGSAALAYPKSAGYPTVHNLATEGKGTYLDPITFAAPPQNQANSYPIGSVIYVPLTRKYYIMEDECGTQSCSLGTNHAILWMGPQSASDNTAFQNCEASNTPNSPVSVIINPASNLSVDTTPELANNQCTLHLYP